MTREERLAELERDRKDFQEKLDRVEAEISLAQKRKHGLIRALAANVLLREGVERESEGGQE